MASSTPIYKAYVGVIPTAKGFGKNLEGELTGNLKGAADRAGGKTGRTLGSTITGAFKKALGIGAVITGAIGAAAIGGGISRQLNIEDAQKKLEGLGHSTKNVTAIMDDALKSVKGTSYGLDEAATIAAGAVAAGVKPGQELTKYLGTTADAATIAGVSLDEMGGVFNKVQTGQKAYTEDLNMLADRGIPIFQWLQEEYGVTAEELRKMVSDGKVDAETYFKVIDENIGGAALKSGETTRGAFKNMLAAFSRIGVALTSGFFPLIKDAFGGITLILDAIEPKLTEIFSPMWQVLAPMFRAAMGSMSTSIADWISNFDVKPIADFFLGIAMGLSLFVSEWKSGNSTVTKSGWPGIVQGVAQNLRGVWDEVVDGIKAFGAAWEANDGKVTGSGFVGFMEKAAFWVHDLVDQFKGLDYSSVSGFFDSLGGMDIDFSGLSGVGSGVGAIIQSVAESFLLIAKTSPKLLAVALDLLARALGFIADHADVLVKLLPYIAAGFLAYKAAVVAVNAANQTALALDVATLPLQIKRNTSSLQAAQARLLAANATKAQTIEDTKQTAATLRGTIAEKARTIATKAGALASKAAAIASRALGAAIRFATGPIGLIIIGITALVAGLIWFFTQTELGQAIWEKVWTAIKDAAGAVADWFMNTVVPLFIAAWDGIAAGAVWLYENVMVPVWNGIKTAISATINWVTGSLVPALITAWQGIASVAQWLYNNIIKPVWEGIKIAIAVVITAIVIAVQGWMALFRVTVAPLFKWLYNSVIKPVWSAIQTAIKAVVDWFKNTAWPALSQAIDWIRTKFEQFKLGLQIIWNFIKNSVINPVVNWFKTYVWNTFSQAITWIRNKFEQFKLGLRIIWTYIKNTVINPVVNWFKVTVLGTFRTAIDQIKAKFEQFKDGLKNIWNFIKNNIIKPVVEWFRDTVKPIFDDVLGKIKDVFEKTKNDIGTVWDKLKEKVKKPIEVVINKVVKPVADTYDKVADVVGAKKINMKTTEFSFWKGGTLPGYTPGKDVFGFVDPVSGMRLNLSGGEPIMRPEFGRLMGKGWIDKVNAAAQSGGVGGVKRAMGFATGGVFPGGEYSAAGGAFDWVKKKASGAKDWLKDAWDTLTDFIDDPKKAFNAVKDGLLSTANIPDDGWGQLLNNSVTKITDGFIDKIFNTQKEAEVPSYTGTEGTATGTGGSLGWAAQLARKHGLTMTSGYRPGATTATGVPSMHGLNRARDFSNGVNTPQMMAFFNEVLANSRPTELLYTPAGSRNLHRSGRQYANTGSTARGHWNHVHVAFKKGGMFEGLMGMQQPTLMDKGGYLQPGVNNIINKTGGYETVIPRAESEMLRQMSADWESGGNEKVSYVYSPNQVDMDEQVERRTRREFETFVDLAKKASR